MSEWMPKAWGWKREILHHRLARVIEELVVEEGGFSSFHLHTNHDNQFIVISGELIVLHQGRDGWDSQLLTSGQCCRVPSGVMHRFVGKTAVHAYEIITRSSGMPIDLNDIIRFSEGGITQ